MKLRTDVEIPSEKVCRICKVSKSSDEFGKKTSAKDGLRTSCNLCRALDGKAYRESRAEAAQTTPGQPTPSEPQIVPEAPDDSIEAIMARYR